LSHEFQAVAHKDFNQLQSGFDFRGDACGKPGTTVEDKPFVFFQDPLHMGTIGMCVTGCPTTLVTNKHHSFSSFHFS